jgi:hypothetical protein
MFVVLVPLLNNLFGDDIWGQLGWHLEMKFNIIQMYDFGTFELKITCLLC